MTADKIPVNNLERGFVEIENQGKEIHKKRGRRG
jgi:hypothetical protein